MNKPHKHAEVIKAWANGQPIEYKSLMSGDWRLLDTSYLGGFPRSREFRIKPENKKIHMRLYKSPSSSEFVSPVVANHEGKKDMLDRLYMCNGWKPVTEWREVEYEDV